MTPEITAIGIEIRGQGLAVATFDHYKQDFSTSSLVINEVVLEGVFLGYRSRFLLVST